MYMYVRVCVWEKIAKYIERFYRNKKKEYVYLLVY